MSKRKPARAQAIRCSDEALERLRVGETVLAVYEDLIERGEIDMAYRTFADWMKRFGEDPETLPKITKSKNASRSRFAAERSSVGNSQARSNKTSRKPGEPFIGSIGIAPDAWKPSAEPPNLKRSRLFKIRKAKFDAMAVITPQHDEEERVSEAVR